MTRGSCFVLALLLSCCANATSVYGAEPYPSRQIPADAAAADIAQLRAVIEQVHAGYGRYTSIEDMDAAFEELERSAGAGLTDEQMVLGIERVLALLRCDHTKGELPEAIEAYRKANPTHFPFTFRIFDGRVYIDRVHPSASGIARGDEVLSINGIPTGRVLAEVGPLV